MSEIQTSRNVTIVAELLWLEVTSGDCLVQPPPKQGQLEPLVQYHVKLGSEYLQG